MDVEIRATLLTGAVDRSATLATVRVLSQSLKYHEETGHRTALCCQRCEGLESRGPIGGDLPLADHVRDLDPCDGR